MLVYTVLEIEFLQEEIIFFRFSDFRLQIISQVIYIQLT